MGYVVRMPKMGVTMEQGQVAEWVVSEGDAVDEGDLLAEVESEKTINEVTAREAGTLLERFAGPGETVAPGDPIAYVGEPGEGVPDEFDAAGADAEGGDAADDAVDPSAAPRDPSPGREGGAPTPASADSVPSVRDLDGRVSPRARALAAAKGLSPSTLDDLDGTGPEGAVVERDVAAVEGAPSDGVADADAGTTGDGAGVARDVYEERTPDGMRRTIADRMVRSAREAPQVTLHRRVDAAAALALADRYEADDGIDLSIVDFLIAAVARAVESFPAFNAVYEDGSHRLARNVNVSLATDVEDGLVTPVLAAAQRRTLPEIRRERRRLVTAARNGQYSADDLAGGTFTVTNLGPYGVETFDPLLNPPQVAILGVGAIETRDGRRRVPLSLTFDHRAVDGADAARFLDAVADALSHPRRLTDPVERSGSEPRSVDAAREGDPAGDADASGERSPDEAVVARSTGGFAASIRAREFRWTADEPERRGGTDAAPTPVEQFLGSLASCLALTIRTVADRREVPLDAVEVTVEPEPDDLSMERLDVAVEVTTAADDAAVERLLRLAERSCPVSAAIDDDLDRRVDLRVTPA